MTVRGSWMAAGLGLALVAAVAWWRPAQAQVSGGDGRFEYAVLELDGPAPVLYEATREVTLVPPRDQPNPDARSLPQFVDQYSFATRNVRHDDVAALNVFGRMGWQLVNVTNDGTHRRAYLRRPM